MTDTPNPTAVTFDANVLLGALAASNPELPDHLLHSILRRMIAEAQIEVSALSSEDHPLKSRIRLPVTGRPSAKPLPETLPTNKGIEASVGQIGHASDTYEMLGPKAAAARIEVSRSTLDNWRRAGLIIALPKGRTGHVIPLVQFVQSRPLPGIDDLLQACSHDAALAWAQLTARLPGSSQAVIDAAAAGNQDAIPSLISRLP